MCYIRSFLFAFDAATMRRLYVFTDTSDCMFNCQVPWTEVVSNIANMTEKMDNFANRCKKLPSRLKEWDAFTQLRLAYATHHSPSSLVFSFF